MGLVARGPFGPRRCHTSHHDVRCNRALPRPHVGGVDFHRCRVARRVDADYRRGERSWSFFLEGAVVDGLIHPFRSAVAHRAFQWQLLVIEKPSFRLVELPPPGVECVPRLECVELGSSMALACCAAALSPPLHFGLLEGNG